MRDQALGLCDTLRSLKIESDGFIRIPVALRNQLVVALNAAANLEQPTKPRPSKRRVHTREARA